MNLGEKALSMEAEAKAARKAIELLVQQAAVAIPCVLSAAQSNVQCRIAAAKILAIRSGKYSRKELEKVFAQIEAHPPVRNKMGDFGKLGSGLL